MSLFKRMVIIFTILLFVSLPIISAQSEVVTHTSTDYEIHTYGVYSGGINNIAIVDGSYARFNETKLIKTSTFSTFEIDTENIVNWTAEAGLSSISVDNTLVLEGTYSIKGVVDDKTNVEFEYDGDLDWDVSQVKSYNISINHDHAATLTEIDLHYDSDTYWTFGTPIVLTKDTWNNLTLYLADFDPVGGMSINHHINSLSYHFTTTKAGTAIYIDDCHLIGEETGDVVRRLSMDLQFSDLPQKDNYQAKIVSRYVPDSSYENAFFTENSSKWDGSTGISMSEDTTDVQYGTYRIVATYDANQNSTIWFDNATSKNMQVDWSSYTVSKLYIWGNDTFSLDYVRWYTDTSNYYYLDVDIDYTTTAQEIITPLSLYSEFGSPSRDNISWIEFKINNIENTNPLEIYFDNGRISDSDSIDVYSDLTANGAQEITYTNLWSTKTLTLDAEIIGRTGIVSITFNDTLHVGDSFNTTFEIDAVYLESWNNAPSSGGDSDSDDTTTTTEPTTSTTREVRINYLPITMIVGILLFVGVYEEWRKRK
ncbi:MAG: hypothetical protein ACTSWQ_00445 [Candidatus Thorarchaeota archaeon]